MAKKRSKKKRRIRWERLALVAGIPLLICLIGYLVIHLITPDRVEADMKQTAASTHAQAKSVKKSNALGTVVLDAGHGGYDEGSSSLEGVSEKQITLDVTLKLGEKLKANNVDVIYTRDSDEVSWPAEEMQDLFARCNISNESDADLFVSIHTNSSEEYDDGARGIEVYTMMSNDTSISLAHHIHEQLTALNYSEDRGVKDEADRPLVVLRYNYVPSVLVEIGFISDTQDKYYMISPQGQDAISSAMCDAILATLQEIK